MPLSIHACVILLAVRVCCWGAQSRLQVDVGVAKTRIGVGILILIIEVKKYDHDVWKRQEASLQLQWRTEGREEMVGEWGRSLLSLPLWWLEILPPRSPEASRAYRNNDEEISRGSLVHLSDLQATVSFALSIELAEGLRYPNDVRIACKTCSKGCRLEPKPSDYHDRSWISLHTRIWMEAKHYVCQCHSL